MKQLFLFLILILSHQNFYSQGNQNILDSIVDLINKAKEETISDDSKIKYSETAFELSLNTKIDSIILKSGKNFSLVYVTTGKYDLYKTPKIILSHLLRAGFKRIDREIIMAGIASNTDAKNNFIGLSNAFAPFISPSTLSGTYNSK